MSLAGGLVSSASAVASGATLSSRGILESHVAGTGAIIASLASAALNIVIVSRVAGARPLARRVTASIALIVLIGAAGALFRAHWPVVR